MQEANGSSKKWTALSPDNALAPTSKNLSPIDATSSQTSNPDNLALLAQLSALNKQIAEFAWRLLNADLTAGNNYLLSTD